MRYYLPGGSFINNENFYIAENARFPKRFYNLEDMKRTDLDLPYILQNTEDMQELLNLSDSLLIPYTSKDNQTD